MGKDLTATVMWEQQGVGETWWEQRNPDSATCWYVRLLSSGWHVYESYQFGGPLPKNWMVVCNG